MRPDHRADSRHIGAQSGHRSYRGLQLRALRRVGAAELLRQAMQPLQAPRCTSGGDAEGLGHLLVGVAAASGPWSGGGAPPSQSPFWEHIEDIEDNEDRALEHGCFM